MPSLASLYILQFPLCAPRKLLEAQQFVQAYQTYSEIYSVPDRLRWCRHELGMMQSEVAKEVGITSIRTWENGQKTISHKCFELLVDNLGHDFTAMLHM